MIIMILDFFIVQIFGILDKMEETKINFLQHQQMF